MSVSYSLQQYFRKGGPGPWQGWLCLPSRPLPWLRAAEGWGCRGTTLGTPNPPKLVPLGTTAALPWAFQLLRRFWGFPGHDSSGNKRQTELHETAVQSRDLSPSKHSHVLGSVWKSCPSHWRGVVVPQQRWEAAQASHRTATGRSSAGAGSERQWCRGVAGQRATKAAAAAASAGEDRRRQRWSSIPNCLFSSASAAPEAGYSLGIMQVLESRPCHCSAFGQTRAFACGWPSSDLPVVVLWLSASPATTARERFVPPKYEY